MNTGKLLGLVLTFLGLGSLLAVGLNYLLVNSKSQAGLNIETSPKSIIFIDGVESGTTPFEKTLSQKEVLIKIIPESTNSAYSTYQTRLRLLNGVTSVIRRQFQTPDSNSSGETISFEKDPTSNSTISIITTDPEYASVSLDGRSQIPAPLIISDTAAGQHQLSLSSPGYESKTISFQNPAGFKTMISAKLAMLPSPSPTPIASASSTKKIKIKDTPTGFLRVRSSPSSGASEVGQVKPGEFYELINQITNWYQIRVNFESTTSGWISSQYSSPVN